MEISLLFPFDVWFPKAVLKQDMELSKPNWKWKYPNRKWNYFSNFSSEFQICFSCS